jgi:hypothetical protein
MGWGAPSYLRREKSTSRAKLNASQGMRFQVESNRRAKDVTGPAVTSCYMQKAASWLKPKAGATAYDIGMEYFTILR